LSRDKVAARATVQLYAATSSRKTNQTDMTDYDILASSLVLVGCLAERKRTINRRAQERLDMVEFRHFGRVFVEEDRKTGKVVQKPCLFKAKFHYTDPTRTGYGQSQRTLSGTS